MDKRSRQGARLAFFQFVTQLVRIRVPGLESFNSVEEQSETTAVRLQTNPEGRMKKTLTSFLAAAIVGAAMLAISATNNTTAASSGAKMTSIYDFTLKDID